MNGKLKAILLLAVMYGLGVASGIAWQGYRFHRMWNPHSMFAEHRIKKLSSQLKLSPTQEQAIREIFQKAHERAVQVNEEVTWDLADIHKDSVKAIKGVLTPAQAMEFDKIHKKYHSRHKNLPEDDDEDDTSPAQAHNS